MALVLGLDGGGTKTSAILLDESRRELGRGQSGPCNIATGRPEDVAVSVREATRSALYNGGISPGTPIRSVCAGVAGYTAKRRRAGFQEFLEGEFPGAKCRVEPDYVTAYWGASEGAPGVAVIAGTGSVAYGRNEDGEACRAGGRGFLLGDGGSGFSIGRGGLGAALLFCDGRWQSEGPEWKRRRGFSKRMLDATGSLDQDDLVEWTYREFSPQRIASLAATIGHWADEGDEIAQEIVRLAGLELAKEARFVVDDLGMNAATTRFWLAGGLWDISRRLETAFKGKGDDEVWDCAIHTAEPLHDPAYGAALLALTDT